MLDWIAHNMLPCLTRISIPKNYSIVDGKDNGRQKRWAAHALGGKSAGRQKSVYYYGRQKSWAE